MKKIRRNHVEIKKIGKVRFLWNEILDIINPIFIDGEVGEGKKRTLSDLEKKYGKKKAKELSHLINNIMDDSSICYGRSDDKSNNLLS